MDLASLYFSPHGRMPRHVYWLATLPLLPLSFLPELIINGNPTLDSALISAAVLLALLVPNCILAIKRCHDRDRSGWFTLIGLIPVLGSLWLLIDLGCLAGTPGQNRFGPDPLAGERDTGRAIGAAP